MHLLLLPKTGRVVGHFSKIVCKTFNNLYDFKFTLTNKNTLPSNEQPITAAEELIISLSISQPLLPLLSS